MHIHTHHTHKLLNESSEPKDYNYKPGLRNLVVDETEHSVPGVLMKILSHTDPNVKIMIVHEP